MSAFLKIAGIFIGLILVIIPNPVTIATGATILVYTFTGKTNT